MARGRKKKLDLLHQADGKVENIVPSTLDQIFGDVGVGKYKTTDLSTYEHWLDNLNLSDMQAHSSRVGLIPVYDRRILKQRLVREFQKHVVSYRVGAKKTVAAGTMTEEAARILGEGK